MNEPAFVAPFCLEYAYKRSLGPVLTAFATALRDGRILGARTPSGRVIVPPKEYDPDTGESVESECVEVGPEGVVTTWAGGPDAGWALVKLDGADTAMLHRTDGEVATGDRVRPVWAPHRVGSILDILHFERAEGERPSAPEPVGGDPVTRFEAPTRLDYRVAAGATTAAFLRGVMARKLLGSRCPDCTKVYIPPRGSCPSCAVAPEAMIELSQTGTVTTFSVIRLPFEGQVLDPPYACAHVLLDGADVPLLHIVGECDPDEVRMGMRVTAVWADTLEPTLASVRYFRPVDEPDVDYAQFKEHV